MNKRNSITITLAIAIVLAFQTSCMNDKKLPGREYMPDMAHSVAYETYAPNRFFPNGTNAGAPVAGTIPIYQGMIGVESHYRPFPYPNTNEGYEAAGKELVNPITPDSLHLAEGKRLYAIYCAICHGDDGKASGHIVVGDNVTSKFPPPPSYFSDNLLHLPEGKMFFAAHYGKNLMGSYSTQIDRNQMWEVIAYVKSMQADYIKSNPSSASVNTTSK